MEKKNKKNFLSSNGMMKFRAKMLGTNQRLGILYKILLYVILTAIGYIFLFPLFKMLSNSLKSLEDLLSPMVNWIPRKMYLDNYRKALKTLNYFPTFFKSLLITLVPALLQTLVLSVIGYGLAKFNFRGKKLLMGAILFAYILPTTTTMIPKFVLFTNFKIINTHWVVNLPALLGQGINSSIFILIFYSFFSNIPKSLEEAAYLDGCSRIQTFIEISIPLVVPAFLTTFLFSFVWYWNETYLLGMFMGNSKIQTLQMALITFDASFVSGGQGNINEAIKDSATILTILPLLIVYLILQRKFVEGIEKTGLAGGE